MADLRTCSKCAQALALDRFSKHGAALRPDCKACRSIVTRAHYERNRDAILARNNAAKAADPEKHKAICAASRAKKIDQYRAKAAEWAQANPEKVAAYAKRWRLAHPESGRTNVRNRDARRKAATGRHTKEDIAELYSKQRGACIYCRRTLGVKYHVDHVQALARGGSNDRMNLQLLCPSCNCSKGAKDPIEFAQKLGMLL